MVTGTSNQLSHEEAAELLPWHVNATLDEPLAARVASHIEHCHECQQESAILESAIYTVNTDASLESEMDRRLPHVMTRIRNYEREEAQRRTQPVVEKLASWLALPFASPRWAGAFALGLVVGIAGLLIVLQSVQTPGTGPTEHILHSDPSADEVRLLVQFGEVPDGATLAELRGVAGAGATWTAQSDTVFVVVFSGDTEVRRLAALRAELAAHEAVNDVTMDIEPTSPPE